VERSEIVPFSPEEVERLLKAAADDRLGALYTVAMAVGLRPSEALGCSGKTWISMRVSSASVGPWTPWMASGS
jgi:hypothetical protein